MVNDPKPRDHIKGPWPAGDAVSLCGVAYRRHQLHDVACEGIDRLNSGFETYGPDAFTEHSEAEWLTESLEELLDAFNMLTGMRSARGEDQLAAEHLAEAIRIVDERRTAALQEEAP